MITRHGTERPYKLGLSKRLTAILTAKYLDAKQDHFLEKSPYMFDKGDKVGNVIVLQRIISEEFPIKLFIKKPEAIDAIHQKLYKVFDYSDKEERVMSEESVVIRQGKGEVIKA